MESSHSEESELEDAGLVFAEDEFKSENNNESKSDITVPRYFKDSETTTVTYCEEE